VSVGAVVGCCTLAAACSPKRPPASTLSATPAATMHTGSPRVSQASKRFSAELGDCDRRLASYTSCVQTLDPGLDGACCDSAPIAPLSVSLDTEATSLTVRMGGGRTATCAGTSDAWTSDLELGTKSPAAATPTPNRRCLTAPTKWQPSLTGQSPGPVTASRACGFRSDFLDLAVQTTNRSRHVLCPWYTRHEGRSTKEGMGAWRLKFD
jgi:hypothetical protein